MMTMTALLLKLALVTAPVAGTTLEFPDAGESGSEYASAPLMAAPVEIVRVPMLLAAPVEIVRVPLEHGSALASGARADHR